GGVLETVRGLSDAHPTGLVFGEQTAEALVAAVDDFAANPARFSPIDCRANAERFSAALFRTRFFAHVRARVPALRDSTLPPAEAPAQGRAL
ncbi:MAG TPA: glycosyl transferase family 1, partial [Paraburkholderia sp.]